MPFLSRWQRRTGRELGSAAVEGDGTQTLLCTYLSAVLLVGLVLNATLGWSWADPVAALGHRRRRHPRGLGELERRGLLRPCRADRHWPHRRRRRG
jgi:hypothetical protein